MLVTVILIASFLLILALSRDRVCTKDARHHVQLKLKTNPGKTCRIQKSLPDTHLRQSLLWLLLPRRRNFLSRHFP